MNTRLKVRDPKEAKKFFEDKISFTAGPAEVEDLIKNQTDINIVDVRAAEDYAEGHVPGAVNLPHDRWDTLAGLQKNKVNILYCYSIVCHLAAVAAMKFAQEGFPVMEMDGGFNSWKEYGYRIEKEEKKLAG